MQQYRSQSANVEGRGAGNSKRPAGGIGAARGA